MALEVHGFHRRGTYAVLTDGQIIPITAWFDSDGDECGPFDFPVSAVAGPDADGKWYALDLSAFDPVPTQ